MWELAGEGIPYSISSQMKAMSPRILKLRGVAFKTPVAYE
jgi:hypothetical protein